jgi:predicted Zn-dependent protease
MTHVLERHSMRQLVYQAGLATALRLLVGSPEGATAVLSGAALDLTALRFSREQETAADRGAIELLTRAGVPASGLAVFFERLARESGTPPAWLSSHPDSSARAALVRAEARHLDGGEAWPDTRLDEEWAAARADAAALSP